MKESTEKFVDGIAATILCLFILFLVFVVGLFAGRDSILRDLDMAGIHVLEIQSPRGSQLIRTDAAGNPIEEDTD